MKQFQGVVLVETHSPLKIRFDTDTNESVDTGEITANTTRTIKIAFKDRPHRETDDARF